MPGSTRSTSISRRNFLKVSALALGCLAANPLTHLLPPDASTAFPAPALLGRVTVELVRRYAHPSFESEHQGWLHRDEVVRLMEAKTSAAGPLSNPLWYRLESGYAHSAHIQPVEQRFHLPPESLPAERVIAEVSVPFTQTYRFTREEGWQPLYRLYYQSTHWVTGIEAGPDGRPWYRLTDERLYVDYHAPAHHLRLIDPAEFSPLASDVPPEDKLIRVSIAEQTLRAYQGETLVHQCRLSSGVHTPADRLAEGELPTDTPLGRFRILTKMPCRHMGNGHLTADPLAYELPGVPWTMIFHEWGVALHGTYWHNNFGTRMSHGCVNLPNADALWLFRWTDPAYQVGEWLTKGRGTWVEIS